MDITDVKKCAEHYRDNYVESFYILTTYSDKSFVLVGEKFNFPHLMGIKKNVYKSNGYRKADRLYQDILDEKSISTRIVPRIISPTSKMYKKVLNFTESTKLLWNNKGPMAINYNSCLSSTKLDNVDILLIDINLGYMSGWVKNMNLSINEEINLTKYCIVTWIDESTGTAIQKEKYMPKQDVDIVKNIMQFDKQSNLVRNKKYKYTYKQKKELLEAIQRNNSNLLVNQRNERYYKEVAVAEGIHCKLNGVLL